MIIPDKTDDDREGLKVDELLDREALEVGSFEENEGLMVDALIVDLLEDHKGLKVGRPTVDRVGVKVVESIGSTFEGLLLACCERTINRKSTKNIRFIRWRIRFSARAFADPIQRAHKDCKNKHAVNRAIMLCIQHPHCLCHFSL